jgi:PAT family beta-lactamase induction signal transducer AmpG
VSGTPLAQIGFASFLGLPWTLKVLWAPLVDRYGGTRNWILGSLLVLGLVLAALSFAAPGGSESIIFGLLLILTLASATQDIAIDATAIRMVDPRLLGAANGIRVTAYRIAMILAGGGLIALAQWVSWRTLFLGAGLLLALMGALAARIPGASTAGRAGASGGTGTDGGSARSARETFKPLLTWLRRPHAGAALVFTLLYKLGDAAMAPMLKPFWVDRGMTLLEIGAIATTAGIGASIAGALLGGLLTTRWGILRALVVLGLFQAGSNLVYVYASLADAGRPLLIAASLFESFSGGLGTAAFLSFLMRICERDLAATQYALLSAVFAASRTVAGGLSGWGAEHLGYTAYFLATFVLALPAYALLPRVRRYLLAMERSGS